MKDLILKKILKQHGFTENDFQINEKTVRIKLEDVNKQELREEGALIPNKIDCNYHNYIYPDGLCPSIDQIKPSFYSADHPQLGKRLQTIKMPLAIYEQLDQFEATANATYETNHRLEKTAEEAIITVDHSKGADGAKYLVNALVTSLMPRIAHKDDIKEGINYISDLGRLAPLLATSIISDLTKWLLNEKPNRYASLNLREQIVNSAEEMGSRTIDLDINIFYEFIEKMIREESYLAELVRNDLKLDEKNWVLADLDLLNNFRNSNTANAKKLLNAVNAKNEPLFLSTTSGNHAFAVKVDFHSKTLFVANPGTNETNNCQEIVDKLIDLTGCTTVTQVVTQKLSRDEDIPLNNVCTVDSLALVQMMMGQDELAQGSLNNMPLKTGELLRKALNETDKPEIKKEALSDFLMDKDRIEQARKIVIESTISTKNYPPRATEGKGRSSSLNLNDFAKIQTQFILSLGHLKMALSAKEENLTKVVGQNLYDKLNTAQNTFFNSLQINAKPEEIRRNLLAFRKSCEKNTATADEIMGYGWLDRIVEVLVKAVIGLFAGIGMVLGSFICRGLLSSEDRRDYRNTFFKLDQADGTLEVAGFKHEIFGDADTAGLLDKLDFLSQ